MSSALLAQAYPTSQSMDEEDGQEAGEVAGRGGGQVEEDLHAEVAALKESLREAKEVVVKVRAG